MIWSAKLGIMGMVLLIYYNNSSVVLCTSVTQSLPSGILPGLHFDPKKNAANPGAHVPRNPAYPSKYVILSI